MLKLVLASASLSRKTLLEKLKIPFECVTSHVDETPLENEDPITLVKRLSKEKAKGVASLFPNSLIIGADTIGILNNKILCKPITKEKAIEQLEMLSEKKVTFYTGLCVFNTKTNDMQLDIDKFDVTFRTLSQTMIQNYLKKESALNCAGSLKIEELGITLVEKLSGNDYTTLIGLPLIKLTKILETMGMPLI